MSRGEAKMLTQLIESVKKACETQWNIRIEKLPKRPGDVGGKFADVTKANQMLDFEAKIDLDVGLSLLNIGILLNDKYKNI